MALNLPKPPPVIQVNTPADWLKAQNAITLRMENLYRRTAYDGIAKATAGLEEGKDFVVTVHGRKTGLAGIRSAKLFQRQGIQMVPTVAGKSKALLEATMRVVRQIKAYNFSSRSTGNFKEQLDIVIDGQSVGISPVEADFVGAQQVIVWSRARYAAPLETLTNGGLFAAAARAGRSTRGIAASAGYLTQAEAVALGQQPSNRWRQLPAPAVFLATAENAQNLRSATARTLQRRERRNRLRK